jgi:hypothetical protein
MGAGAATLLWAAILLEKARHQTKTRKAFHVDEDGIIPEEVLAAEGRITYRRSNLLTVVGLSLLVLPVIAGMFR